MKDRFAHLTSKDHKNDVVSRTLPDKNGDYKINGYPCRESEPYNKERYQSV